MIGVIGIILSLGLLMYLAYRGITVLILAPILALVAAAFLGHADHGDLHPCLHAQPGQLPEAVFPGVPARRHFREGDGGFGQRQGDRALHRREGGQGARHPGRRPLLRHPDLRRRFAVRRGLRGLPDRRAPVPRSRHAQVPDSRRHRARLVHLHDDRATGNAADPERHPDAVLQDDGLCGADSGHHLRPDHVRRRYLVADEPRARKANARGEFYGDHPNEVVKEFDNANLPERRPRAAADRHRSRAQLHPFRVRSPPRRPGSTTSRPSPSKPTSAPCAASGRWSSRWWWRWWSRRRQLETFRQRQGIGQRRRLRLDAADPQHGQRSRLRQRGQDARRLRHRPGGAARDFRQSADHLRRSPPTCWPVSPVRPRAA